jgi:hypothetical protein
MSQLTQPTQPAQHVNRFFAVIDQKYSESKALTLTTINDVSQLDEQTRGALLLQLSKKFAALKLAIDTFQTDIAGINLAVTTLNSGLSPAESLAKLTTQYNELKK